MIVVKGENCVRSNDRACTSYSVVCATQILKGLKIIYFFESFPFNLIIPFYLQGHHNVLLVLCVETALFPFVQAFLPLSSCHPIYVPVYPIVTSGCHCHSLMCFMTHIDFNTRSEHSDICPSLWDT